MEAAVSRRLLFKLYRENRAVLALYPLILGVLLPIALSIPRPYDSLAEALFFGMVMIAGPFMLPCATIILAFMSGYMVVAPGVLYHAEVLPVRRFHLLLYYFLPSFLFFTLMGFVGAWVTYYDMENVHPSRYYAWPILFASAYLLGLAASLMSDKIGKQQPYWRIVVFPIVLIIGAFVSQGFEDPEFRFPTDVMTDFLWVVGFTVAALYANSDKQRRILRWSALGLILITVIVATRTDIAAFIAGRGSLQVNQLVIGHIRSSDRLIRMESSYDSSGFHITSHIRSLDALSGAIRNREATWTITNLKTYTKVTRNLDVLMQPVAVGNDGTVLLGRPTTKLDAYLISWWNPQTNAMTEVASVPVRARKLFLTENASVFASPDARYLLVMTSARYGQEKDLWLVNVGRKSSHLVLANQPMNSMTVQWHNGKAMVNRIIIRLDEASAELVKLEDQKP